MTNSAATILTVALTALAGPALAQSCVPDRVPHRIPGIGSKVYAMVEFDDDNDGTPSLIAGGDAPFVASATIAKLQNGAWVRLGTGLAGNVRTLLVHDSGSGPKLYAGASSQVYRLDGQTWTAVATNTFAGQVLTMTFFDDGSGEKLYAGGLGGAGYIMRVNAAGQWEAVGGTTSHRYSRLQGMQVLDPDGDGPQRASLYAAGSGLLAGSTSFLLLRWDGISWSGITPNSGAWVKSMILHDDGTGKKIVVTTHPSGTTTSVPFNQTCQVAGWNGSAWTQYHSPANVMGPLYAMVSFRDEAGGLDVIWGHDATNAFRVSIGNVSQRFPLQINAIDYSAITPAKLRPIGTGPETIVMQSSSGFVKIAACPRLVSDYTLDGRLTIDDIYDFLDYWMSVNRFADFDKNGSVQTADIFAFLNAWFAGI